MLVGRRFLLGVEFNQRFSELGVRRRVQSDGLRVHFARLFAESAQLALLRTQILSVVSRVIGQHHRFHFCLLERRQLFQVFQANNERILDVFS